MNDFHFAIPSPSPECINANPVDTVDHTYQDHINDDAGPHLLHQLILDSTKSRHGCDHPFPVKLHYMLGKISEDGLSHVVSWQPHGRCFIVHDQKEFVEKVLKCWFRQSKFASFQRQLNLYGFRRLTAGQDKGGYYHEFFLRGSPLLAHRIQRTKVKGTGTRKPSSPESEPNFYLMPYSINENKRQNALLAMSPTASLTLNQVLPGTHAFETQRTQQSFQPQQQIQSTSWRSVIDMGQYQGFNVGSNGSRLSGPFESMCEDYGNVQPSLAVLTPLMSYLNGASNTTTQSSQGANLAFESDAINNYETVLSMIARGTNPSS